MDYRAWGSWIGKVRGRLGKAGYGGSDVACILVCISSIMRVRFKFCPITYILYTNHDATHKV